MTTTTERTGLWLVGAGGSVAATVACGLAALRAGVVSRTGLVTAQADLEGAGLIDTTDLVTGGHDVTDVSLAKRAEALAVAGVVPHDLPPLVAHELDEASTRIRHGYVVGAEGQRDAVARLAADLRDFREREGLTRVVVVNVSSTEAPVVPHAAHADRGALERAWDAGESPLPPSSVYAAAAFTAGCAFVDFTPSAGARLPVLEDLAEEARMPWGGSDGKTGETLLKSVIAPMFAMRSLDVRSWAGTNLLGGGDGATLASPDARRSKIESKAAGLEALLGHTVEGPLHIDHVADLGDWKTAWDHVTFAGLPRDPDDPAVHLAGVRLRPRGTARHRPRAAARPRDATWGARAGRRARLLLQGPGGARRARPRPAARPPRPLGDGGCGRAPMTTLRDLAELVRAPAALSVPGDSLAGAAAAGWPAGRRTALLPVASVSLYWAGMALNDWADRELDAVERPERPVPSGRVSPRTALGLATGLTATGVGLAAVAGGVPAAVVASALAGAVWAYDLSAKSGPVSTAVMASTRGLDVLLGAAAGGAPALRRADRTRRPARGAHRGGDRPQPRRGARHLANDRPRRGRRDGRGGRPRHRACRRAEPGPDRRTGRSGRSEQSGGLGRGGRRPRGGDGLRERRRPGPGRGGG